MPGGGIVGKMPSTGWHRWQWSAPLRPEIVLVVEEMTVRIICGGALTTQWSGKGTWLHWKEEIQINRMKQLVNISYKPFACLVLPCIVLSMGVGDL